jgi:ketosteroid isomerase-like protein
VPEGKVEIARRALQCFNSDDRHGLDALTAANVEIVPMRAALEGTVFSGENAVAEFWKAMDETWEYTYIDADEILDCGEKVLIVGQLRGRAKGTDVEVDSPMGWVLAFEDDKVASLRTYPNIAQARRDAGLAT